MKNITIRWEVTCLLLSTCNELFAYAGPADRYINMMRAQTTIAYLTAIIVVAIIALNRFGSNIDKRIITTAQVMYSVSWVMVGLGLFNSWPFFFATVLAPIYIYPK